MISGYIITFMKRDEMRFFFSYAFYIIGFFNLIVFSLTISDVIFSPFLVLFFIPLYIVEIVFVYHLSKNNMFNNLFGIKFTDRQKGVYLRTLWYTIFTTGITFAFIIIIIFTSILKYS
jgi:hypothetical protein